MFNISEEVETKISQNKGLILLVLAVLVLLIPSIFVSQTQADKAKEVLAAISKVIPEAPAPNPVSSAPAITITPTPTPTITITPSPTPAITLTPTPVLTVTTTPTPTVTPSATNTPTPTLTPASNAPIPTVTPTPTPAGLQVQIGIDYAGQKNSDLYTTTVNQGQSAWDAVVAAVGLNNLKYTDYGGNMGIFITEFNGISADSSHYFEFQVNGVSSNSGVSSYKVNDGDKLDFVLTSF